MRYNQSKDLPPIASGRRAWVYLMEIAIFAAVVIVNLAPFIWGALTSLKPIREVLAYPPKAFGSAVSAGALRGGV